MWSCLRMKKTAKRLSKRYLQRTELMITTEILRTNINDVFPSFFRPRPSPIGHVRYINILTEAFRTKLHCFLICFCLSILKRDLDKKKTSLKLEFCPESLGATLEYCYIERGLLLRSFYHRYLGPFHRTVR